jgi:hypothetical protein
MMATSWHANVTAFRDELVSTVDETSKLFQALDAGGVVDRSTQARLDSPLRTATPSAIRSAS